MYSFPDFWSFSNSNIYKYYFSQKIYPFLYPSYEKCYTPWVYYHGAYYPPLHPSQQAIFNCGWENHESAHKFFVPLQGPFNSDDECTICLESVNNGKEVSEMTRCSHHFHTECIQAASKVDQRCPICRACGPKLEGNCPPGRMVWKVSDKLRGQLAGYEDCKVIVITYQMNGGIQDGRHQNPGVVYAGRRSMAYLPDNPQGRRVLELFKQAWKMKRTFTIGRSLWADADNRITWNDIHHKTSIEPNAEYGYPDPTYLTRVVEDMKAMGIQ